MERIAFYLDHVAVAILGEHAAAGRALATGCRIPRGLARHDIFRRDDIRN
jgi:hypothetical protein